MNSEYRTGIGFDVHAFAEGRKLIIGGKEIPFKKGLAGHSDADVLLHAICDAFLGALALGDIGKHFPDTDPRYKDIDSLKLLQHVGRLLTAHGYEAVNIDAMLILDPAPMWTALFDDLSAQVARESIAARFHAGLAWIRYFSPSV